MPLKRSSTSNSSADRVHRKVKVAIGKLRGSSDGVRTLESKYNTDDKPYRKVKVSTGRLKRSSDGVRAKDSESSTADRPYWKVKGTSRKMKQLTDGVRTVEPKEKRTKKLQRRQNGDDSVTYTNVNEKSSKFRGRGERDLTTRGGNMGFEVVIDGNSDRKRKRIYADAGAVENGPYEETFYRKSVSKAQRNTVEPYPDKVKNMSRHKPRDLESSGKYESNAGNIQFKGTERRDRKNVRDKLVGADKPRHVRESRLGNRIMKKSDRRRTLLPTETDMNQRKFAVDSAERPRRNNVRGMKSVSSASELTEDMPKKKKRVIRIDPYDISNKRMDDGISNNGNSQGNKELAETSEVEMSKNAQFRAILPSSSILSFVDDNLLGRRRDIDFRRDGYNIELPAPLDNIPFSTSSERERIEVPVFRNKLEFFAAAKISSSFPSPELPEIAFAGRSNVGKSSLLNALTRQWGVVRTSDKPGLTQTINFFKLGPKLSLVDLPGYGFAYAKEEVKEAWEELVKEYVASRESLKRVCLLVDTKWGLKPRDHELIDLMERSQTNYQIVLTKTDTVFPIDVARRAMQIEESLKAKKSAVQPLMMVSSKSGAGIRSLRTALANILRFAKR